MKITNVQMAQYLTSLQSISNKVKGKLGYAVARNIRKISNELTEYNNIRDEYICKYGTKNENGEYVIHQNTEAFNLFLTDMQEFACISHDVDIYTVDAEEFEKSDLTAEEIINVDFIINE